VVAETSGVIIIHHLDEQIKAILDLFILFIYISRLKGRKEWLLTLSA